VSAALVRSHRRLTAYLAATAVFAGCVIAGSKGPDTCRLTIDVPTTAYTDSEPIKANLILSNPGREAVAIAKPLLPTGWTVKYRSTGDGEPQHTEWDGGVVRGTTHLGGPPRYKPTEYAMIGPGSTYQEAIDVAWYLRNQRERPPVGEYELTVWYDAPPNESERDLPLISYRVTSNVAQIVIRLK
jgi:hypothetical protein